MTTLFTNGNLVDVIGQTVLTGGSSLDANIQLVYNNAKLATATACELVKLAK